MKSATLVTCIVLCLAVCTHAPAQPLFSYGSQQVSKEEFTRAFAKNSSQQKPGEKDYRDYLKLYIRYKLKVKAAYDMRLDTLPAQVAELNDFRKQLAESFINDDTSVQSLIREAFARSRKDVHLAHIFIPFNHSGPAQPADTTKAFTQAMNAWHELQKGTDFGNVATMYSADSTVRVNKGDIGYITVFTLPYALENIAYATPPGAFSKPYRSRLGYHIFKNLGERKAAGRIKLAQILFAIPPGAGDAISMAIKQKADSVYQALLTGASFAQLVTRYSNDNQSYLSGGQLEAFGVGQYGASFENAAFSLPANGALSKPVLTAHGYHILLRMEHYPVNTDPANQEAMGFLKRQVLDDPRMETARQAMGQKLYRVTGVKKAAVNEKSLWAYADSTLRGKKLPVIPGLSGQSVLFSFPKERVTAAEWLSYLQTVKNIPAITSNKSFRELLQQYEDLRVREYYERHLEAYNTAFAMQLQEFKDGNLLFEMMQRNVWDKAAADTTGLMKYFNGHKATYWWQPGADAVVFTCTDSATAYEVKKTMNNSKDWRNALVAFGNNVQADSGRFEFSQLPLQQNTNIAPGSMMNPVKNAGDSSSFSFVYIVKVYPQPSARSFEEAKGLVLNDYQNVLEDQMIQRLQKKYPVKVNEKVLASMW